MRIIPSKKILSYAHPLLLTGVFLFTVPFAHAEVSPYIPLVGLPGLPVEGAKSIPEYINQVYLLVIGIGALAGVLRIAWAGVKYSLSDVVTEKSEAKHDITGVLMGLAILLVPFAVLSTINPDLVNLNVLQNVEKINTDVSATDANYIGENSFVCTTPECQNSCRTNQRGAIVKKDGVDTCKYNKANIFRPARVVPKGTDTKNYISCRRSGKIYDTITSQCTDRTDSRYDLGSYCGNWGGVHDVSNTTAGSGTCNEKELTSAEVYLEETANSAGYDLKNSWEAECRSTQTKLQIIPDGDYVTYACFK